MSIEELTLRLDKYVKNSLAPEISKEKIEGLYKVNSYLKLKAIEIEMQAKDAFMLWDRLLEREGTIKEIRTSLDVVSSPSFGGQPDFVIQLYLKEIESLRTQISEQQRELMKGN